MRYIAAAALLLVPLAAQAQEVERLPDLTPQEFEIRGDLQVSLPDLERQPLRGFAPPPRTYIVPADRQPFVAPYAQRLDDLPENPLPAAVPPSLLAMTPRVGQIDLMAGRYLGRRGRLTFGAGALSVDAVYHGYSEFAFSPAAPRITAQADNLRGRVGFSGGDALRFAVAADGAYHGYHLMGAYTGLLALDDPRGPSARQIRSIGLEGRIEGSAPLTPFSVDARFESARIEDPATDAFAALHPAFDFETQETRLVLGASVELAAVRVSGRSGMSGVGDDGLGSTLLDYEVGVSAAIPLGGGNLRIGGRVFGFDRGNGTADDQMVRVAPVLELDQTLAGGTRLYAWNRSGIEARGLSHLVTSNPYVLPSPQIAPDIHLLNAEGGLEVQLQAVLLNAYVGARRSPHLLYFERGVDEASTFDLYVPRYDAASLYRTGANLTVHGPANISASAGMEYRSARLTEQDRDVPYVSPLVWRLSLSVPFAQERGLLQAALHAEGSRPTEPDGADAPGWGDLSLEAHYRLAGRFGLVGRAEHLGVRAERWPGFPQPPSIIMAGVRAGW